MANTGREARGRGKSAGDKRPATPLVAPAATGAISRNDVIRNSAIGAVWGAIIAPWEAAVACSRCREDARGGMKLYAARMGGGAAIVRRFEDAMIIGCFWDGG